MFRKLWADDRGAVLTVEYTLLAGVAVFGALPGMVALRDTANRGAARIDAAMAAALPDPEAVRQATAPRPAGPPAIVVSNTAAVTVIVTPPQP